MAPGPYRDGLLDGLLDLHALAGDGLIQLSLEGQQVHVSLGLWDQVSDLKPHTDVSLGLWDQVSALKPHTAFRLSGTPCAILP